MKNICMTMCGLCLLIAFNSCAPSVDVSFQDEIVSAEKLDEHIVWMQTALDLDEPQVNFFINLNHIRQGRSSFLTWLSQGDLETMTALEQLVVNEEDFEHVTRKIFSFIADNKLTYKNIFDDIQQAEQMADDYWSQLIEIYGTIDSICLAIQREGNQEMVYTTPEKLDGFCPFLPKGHELYLKADSLLVDRDARLSKQFPLMTELRKLDRQLFK
jgi:hypothetical protein